MKQWTVDDVDETTQNLAGLAATRAGLSVGKWLDETIRKKTGLTSTSTVNTAAAESRPPPAAPAPRQPPPQRPSASVTASPAARPDKAAGDRGHRGVVIIAAVIAVFAVAGAVVWKMDMLPKQLSDKIASLSPGDSSERPAGGAPAGEQSAPSAPEIPAAMTAERLKTLAAENNAAAQVELGKRLLAGRGMQQDYAQARALFEAAAKSGSADAMFEMARLYEEGLGIPADQETATRWYKRAVSAGSADAATKLVARENQTSRERIAGANPDAAPGNTNSADGAPLSPAEITELQKLLARLDLTPGAPNGEMTAETIAAVKLYQRFAGLPEDGKATADLLRDLRQVVDAMTEKPASP